MSSSHKILLLDDDQDLLELYQEMLSKLPSAPKVYTVTSGTRAISLLESKTFHLLMCDLNMPKMDGLQVLAVVRRKFPQMRTAVMTSVVDEQYRTRAYAMGVDLYLEKPSTKQEIDFFLECVESLLSDELRGGFRGVQSKSLVDIIQLECMSGSSLTVRVLHNGLEGKIWFINGEIIDALTNDVNGVEAFRKILSWKTGSFEILPPDEQRTRQIELSSQELLLECAQALDERENREVPEASSLDDPAPFGELSQFPNVQWLLEVQKGQKLTFKAYGVENPEAVAQWCNRTLEQFQKLGDELQAGFLNFISSKTDTHLVALAARPRKRLCAGLESRNNAENEIETLKSLVAQWDS